MKAAYRASILTGVGLVVAANNFALAGPQSVLDPYLNVQAPSSLNNRMSARKSAQVAKPAKSKETVSDKSPSEKPEKKAAPVAKTSSESDGGLLAGPKEVMDGIGRTTKAAGSGIVNSTKMAGSTMMKGGKKVSDGVMNGTKFMGHGIANGFKSAGQGLKAAGGRLKDGTEAAGSKLAIGPKAIGNGLKSTGGKLKDGTQAVGGKMAVVPRKLGHGLAATASKVKDGTEGVGRKVAGVPLSMTRKLLGRGGGDSAPKATASAKSADSAQ